LSYIKIDDANIYVYTYNVNTFYEKYFLQHKKTALGVSKTVF